ncbi:MAG: non-ribosomal peptide synthetase, partial [Candidatus Binatia bacterium]
MEKEVFVFPASFAQQRLWFLDQLEPGSSAYNIPAAFRLTGRLNVAALEQSLNEILARHEVLRTSFSGADGQPVQVIAPTLRLSLPVTDLTAAPQTEREIEAIRLMNQESRRPFDLAQAPLLRAGLLRLAEESHILLLCNHHIISDGWSMGVLLREISALYDAFSSGRPSPLPPLPIQYADFAVWQRQWLEGETLQKQLSYWKNQLDGMPRLLELPTDHSRPAFQTFRGAHESLTLPQPLTEAIKRLSRQEGTTLFMTLLGAFKTLLYRLTGQNDIVVGTPIAGRNRAEIEPLIGFFINSLVLRTDLSGNPSFRQLLRRVRRTALDAYAHQDLPFERLVEELRPERDLSRTPLFQVFFNTINLDGEPFRLRGLKTEPLSGSASESKFDVTLYVRERAGQIHFRLVYNSDLFCRERMVEMLEQFKQLLEQTVENPDIEIGRPSLITQAAGKILPNPTQTLRSEWHGPVHERVAQRSRQAPQEVAVVDKKASWTYGELDSRSNQLAHYLLANGIQAGDLVAVYGHRSASLVSALLGALKAGAAFLILDPAYPGSRLIEYLRAARPRGWLQADGAGELSADVKEFLESSSFRCRLHVPSPLEAPWRLAGYPIHDPQAPVGPDDLAYVAFTSGSTGEPKAILGTHRPLSHFFQWQGRTFGLDERDRFSFLSGLSHDPALRDIFMPLWLGATLCIPDPEELGSPGYPAQWIRQEGITVAHLTPAMVQLLTEDASGAVNGRGNNLPASSLRYAFFGGDTLTTHDLSRLQNIFPSAACVNFYGATETPQAMGYFIVPTQSHHAQAPAKEIIPLGQGIEGVQLLVLNNAERPAGIGELGEIAVRTPYLTRGYLDDAALTQQRFAVNPFTNSPGDRFYKTGDKGRYLPDGNVEFVGRKDRQVKIRGFRIEPGEIEAVLRQHPAVRDTVVVAREEVRIAEGGSRMANGEDANPQSAIRNPQSSEKRLVAYVVLNQNLSPSSTELRGLLRS